jgi:hypothetical protein
MYNISDYQQFQLKYNIKKLHKPAKIVIISYVFTPK